MGKKDFIKKNDLSKWQNNHVQEWIKLLKLGDENKIILLKTIKSRKITGKDVENWDLTTLKDLFGDLDDFTIKKVLTCTNKLKKQRKYKMQWTNIFGKISRSAQGSESLSELESAANLLSTKTKFEERYFSFFVDFFKYTEMKQAGEDEKELEKMRNSINERYKVITGKDFFDKGMAIIKLADYDISNEGGWKIPCKIIITDIYGKNDTGRKKIRSFLSPVVNVIPNMKKNVKFGMFHAAVIVGPWYLEWNTGELVIPKKMFGSTKALISHDVPHAYSSSSDSIEVLVDKLVSVIHLWNTQYSYARNRGENKGNCQHFVDDVLKSMNIQQDIFNTGALGSFVKNLRNKGSSELGFEISKKLKEKAKLKEKKQAFTTHKQLDLFVKDIIEKVENFEHLFRDEYLLLKSFDRAFWLRHFRFPDLPEYKPLQKEGSNDLFGDDDFADDDDDDFGDDDDLGLDEDNDKCMCPFNDPRKTASYTF